MTAVTLETHSDDWYAERATGIGSSEIATIAGIGRWGSRWQLWAEKTGRITPDRREATEAMDMGREAEPWLTTLFERRTGLWTAGHQLMLRHPSEPWARTTVDAAVVEAEDSLLEDSVGALELKFETSTAPWCRDCGPDDVCRHPVVPDYYAAQAQWHCYVGGWPCCWFGVLHSYGRFRVYQLDRNDEDIAALVRAARWFWELVQTDSPPAVDGSPATSDALAAAHPPDGEIVDVDDMVDTIEALVDIKAAIKRYEQEARLYENQLKARLGTAVVGRVDGRDAVTWKPSVRTTVDAKALRAAYPRAAKKFERTTEVRTLLIKEPKP